MENIRHKELMLTIVDGILYSVVKWIGTIHMLSTLFLDRITLIPSRIYCLYLGLERNFCVYTLLPCKQAGIVWNLNILISYSIKVHHKLAECNPLIHGVIACLSLCFWHHNQTIFGTAVVHIFDGHSIWGSAFSNTVNKSLNHNVTFSSLSFHGTLCINEHWAK